MDWNLKLFLKINSLVGQNKWLDSFGRAGAEWVIVGMLGWYGASAFIKYSPNYRPAFAPILWLGIIWMVAWFLDIVIALIVQEPRPRLAHPTSKTLFKPMMSWKSFPSDHAMSAWLIFFTAMFFHLPSAWALFPLALWVSWGRVYAGAHYPLDIIGGFSVAVIVIGGILLISKFLL